MNYQSKPLEQSLNDDFKSSKFFGDLCISIYRLNIISLALFTDNKVNDLKEMQ